MSRIRSKNTKIETRVFSRLRKDKVYFQKHYKKAPGSPDLAWPMKKRAVFIDGDFWHGYQFNKMKKRLPNAYWLEKIETNIKRDRRNRRKMMYLGWKYIRIWEHEIEKDFELAIKKIKLLLKD
ncbi:MAG: Vsr domain protein mismatch repair endonuclease [Candidatus Adlerbacteria bacterium]|nr:Vsr domain protein mismatch repair endonuclease [Candidatus Adlerbacteria bacterium]